MRKEKRSKTKLPRKRELKNNNDMDKAGLIAQIKNAQDAEDLQKIVDIVNTLSASDREEIEPLLEEMGNRFLVNAKETINAVKIAMQLEDVSNYISISYIAKRFFGKSRSWLHNKINGNFSNGKPSSFSDTELKKLKEALNTLSEELKKVSFNLSY